MLDLGSDEFAAHKLRCEEERLAESVRLLYVALTRARHQCHLVWGRFNFHERSAATWVLHPPPGETHRALAAFPEHAKALTLAQMRRDLAALEQAAPQAIAIENLSLDLGAPRFSLDRETASPLVSRTFRGRIARDWRIASFTSLTTAREAEQPDFDQISAPAAEEVALSGIHAFARGPRAGVCLHEIFEALDFTAAKEVEEVVARKLQTFGFDTPEARLAVSAAVRRVLRRATRQGVHAGSGLSNRAAQ